MLMWFKMFHVSNAFHQKCFCCVKNAIILYHFAFVTDARSRFKVLTKDQFQNAEQQ